MRRWRVGSLSMGLSLVLLGLALFLRELGRDAFSLASRWWGLIPMLLGIEMVAAAHFAGREDPPIRYDAFGIVAALFVMAVSIAVEGLNVGGVLPAIHRTFGSAEYSVDIPGETVPLDGIQKVVVTGECDEMDIRGWNDEVTFFGRCRVSALNHEEALSMAEQGSAGARREGDTLFLSLGTAPGPSIGRTNRATWTLLVPAGVDLESSSSGRINVTVDGLAADWSVTARGPMSVRLGTGEDLSLAARAPSVESAHGIPWAEGDRGEDAVVVKTAVLGDGRFELLLKSNSAIEVQM